jgi:hypothetical protein
MGSTFFAYPSWLPIVGETVEQALSNLREKSGIMTVRSWRENDIATFYRRSAIELYKRILDGYCGHHQIEFQRDL